MPGGIPGEKRALKKCEVCQERHIDRGYADLWILDDRPWCCPDHFCRKQKNVQKKLFPKEKEKLGGRSRVRNKLCIKMRFFMYTVNSHNVQLFFSS